MARMKMYDYSEPLFEERLALYVRKGKAFHFSQFSDLQEKIIVLNWGWSYGDEFDAALNKYRFHTEEADSAEENFRKLIDGKIDCLIADQVAAFQIIRKDKLDDQVERLDKPVAVNEAYLAFAKRLRKTSLLNRFDKALAEMKADGSYQKLIDDFIARSPK